MNNDVLLVLGQENFRDQVGDFSHVSGIPRLSVEFVKHTRNPVLVIARAAAIIKAIQSFKPDVLHCQETTRDYLALALPFIGQVPLVMTVHDPEPHTGWDALRRNRSRHGLYFRQLRRRANWVFVHGESLVEAAERSIPRLQGRISAVPHGPLGGFMPPMGTDWEQGVCLFFGRIEAYKGLFLFIQAIRQLRARGVAVKGLIAGRGTDLDLMRADIATDPGFEIIDKYLSPQETWEVFRRANVVVMPYRDATQSGVAAYAMGLGRPVVATQVGALADMVWNSHNGILVTRDDVGSLVDAIQGIVESNQEAKRMAKNAHSLARSVFSWARIADMTKDIYRFLLA